jgi:predicted AAA+ superfamily ATPase
MLYLSADNPLLAGESLYNAVKSVFMAGYEGIIIDEVHYARDWSLHLKALYDDFPTHKLWVSDSSSLVLRSGYGDTSRRFVPIKMPFLSFREFLYLETGTELAPIDPFNLGPSLPVRPSPEILTAFRKYRAVGTRPFYAEGNFEERLMAVLDKTLYADVPFFLPNVTDGNLRLMRAIVGTLASAGVPRLQVRSLCADWGIGAEKLYQILAVMESVEVLRILRVEKDTKAKTAGDKLFFADPALYPLLRGNAGTAREALVATLCAEGGWKVETTRDDSTGDFVISRAGEGGERNLKLEVGCASKSLKSADVVIRDDIDYPTSHALPLWLLGLGW